MQDIVNKRFGTLLVLEYSHTKNRPYYKCQCDCGRIVLVSKYALKNGSRTSCGLCQNKYRLELEKYINRRFGKLTIIGITRVKVSNKYNNRLICRCVCGSIVVTRLCDLKKGKTTACQKHNKKSLGWYVSIKGKRLECDTPVHVLYTNWLIKNNVQFEYKPKGVFLDSGYYYQPDFYFSETNEYSKVYHRRTNSRQVDYNTEFAKYHVLKIYTWEDIKSICGFDCSYSTLINRAKRSNMKITEFFRQL